QRLPIEPISQASANQRAGRCGRVAPGVCIRLYSEDDFDARPEFTDPEILRTNLASVILRMADARLGDIADFPFVEAPDHARITDGLRLLDELGALSHSTRGRGRRGKDRAEPSGPRLTKTGQLLSRMPVDPRLARMLVAADHLDCLAEVLVIVAGLAIQDPRERPTEEREAAEAMHRRFRAPMPTGPDDTPEPDGSDFIAWLRLWQYLTALRQEVSGNQFRKRCRAEYLNFVRIREWQDLHAQLREITRELGLRRSGNRDDPDRIHRALLTGLLSNIGLAEATEERPAKGHRRDPKRRGPRTYTGARGTRFAINPGSAVAKNPPELVMAAEIVETTRLWARTVAGIDARWVEEAGRHLLKRSYGEPHFSAHTGTVLAPERVTLLGVPIVVDRRVDYARVNPAVAREVFIRTGLVEQQWRTRHRFFGHNAALRAEAAEVEERTRRRGVVADDEVLYAFYDDRLPDTVTSGATLDRWWREHGDDGLLDLTMDMLLGSDVDTSDFPDRWPVADHELPVAYVWSPGAGHDGVTVRIDLRLLNQIPAEAFTWQVPGLRGELAVALIKSLPKQLRTNFVPAPDVAARALSLVHERDPDHTSTTLPEALADALRSLTGVQVPAEAWGTHPVPDHLQVGFVITDPGGKEIARGKDLPALRDRLADRVSASLTALLPSGQPRPGRTRRAAPVTGATDWTFDDLPVEARSDGGAVGYPALIDRATGVDVVVGDHRERARIGHRGGVRRLLTLTTPDPTMWVVTHLTNVDKLSLADNPYPGVPALLADARVKAVADCAAEHLDPAEVRTRAGFEDLRERIRPDIPTRMREVVATTAEILRHATAVRNALTGLPADSEIRTDLTGWLADLLYPGFLTGTPEPHFGRLVTYLRAAEHRITAWRNGGSSRDTQQLELFWAADDRYAELVDGFPPGPVPAEVAEIGWLLEEYRVSLFAQQLGTRVPVSAKRVRKAIDAAPRRWA
ncbi:MAG: ATP-dependent RNA helicase HrpA, partial [Propionibacterium sp.]|nr:ATP-dependent RNA helicase HrpA [Propionibacterium sp.]